MPLNFRLKVADSLPPSGLGSIPPTVLMHAACLKKERRSYSDDLELQHESTGPGVVSQVDSKFSDVDFGLYEKSGWCGMVQCTTKAAQNDDHSATPVPTAIRQDLWTLVQALWLSILFHSFVQLVRSLVGYTVWFYCLLCLSQQEITEIL